jgi:hypothetical protein
MEVHDRAGNLIQIPADHGFCLILSHHWRKAMVFDYSVFGPSGRPRTEDPSRLFGHVYARLLFQEMYAITDAQWARLFEWGWFPFVGTRHDHRRQLLSWAATARYPAPLLEEICRTFTSDLDARLENWKGYELLERQMGFLAIARDRFRAGDHVSCISVLYPRIEGVMRSLYDQENPGHRAGQEEMVTNLVENQSLTSMLLPQRFRDYLRAVYFENFNLSSGEIPLSRHSHAHGVSQLGDYNLIRAAVGFMIVDQLFHYLSD